MEGKLSPPAVAVGDEITFGNFALGVVRNVYSSQRPNGALFSAVVGPGNPAAYDFSWSDEGWHLIDGPEGGTYIREGHRDWCYAKQLIERSRRR